MPDETDKPDINNESMTWKRKMSDNIPDKPDTAKNRPARRKKPRLEYLAITKLAPYARNSRTHSPEQIAQIAASIREFGFTNPVLIDAGNGIVAGHGRVQAAQSLGLASVPCLRLEGLTEAQIRAYVIADNKLALNAGWDDAVLAGELKALADLDFDLDLVGFSAQELNDLLKDVDAPQDSHDDVANQPVKDGWYVMVTCRDDAEQRRVLEKMTQEGYECRALTS